MGRARPGPGQSMDQALPALHLQLLQLCKASSPASPPWQLQLLGTLGPRKWGWERRLKGREGPRFQLSEDLAGLSS